MQWRAPEADSMVLLALFMLWVSASAVLGQTVANSTGSLFAALEQVCVDFTPHQLLTAALRTALRLGAAAVELERALRPSLQACPRLLLLERVCDHAGDTQGRYDALLDVLHEGVDVAQADARGRLPLVLATQHPTAFTHLLLLTGASVNDQEPGTGIAALHAAVQARNYEVRHPSNCGVVLGRTPVARPARGDVPS